MLSGFLNHCNGSEGTHNFGDLLQIQTRSSGKGGNRGKPWYPSHPWNKQTGFNTLIKAFAMVGNGKSCIWALLAFVLELDSSRYRRQKWIIIFGQNLAIPDIVWSMNVQNYVACNFHRGANVDKPSALSHYLLQWLLCKLFVHTNTRGGNLENLRLQRKFVCSHKTWKMYVEINFPYTVAIR